MRCVPAFLVLVTSLALGNHTADAANTVGYITGISQPWGRNDNIAAMNQVFGSGHWDQLTWGTGTGALTSHQYDFLFVDGGNGQSSDFNEWVDSNRSSLESFVSAGSSLFLNAARWDQPDLDLGFGVTLYPAYNVQGHSTAAAQATSMIDGPFGATGTDWSGDWFSHDSLSGAIGTPYLVAEDSSVSLAGKPYGAGFVMFGGITAPYYQQPQPESYALRANMIDFAYSQTAAPEPSSLVLGSIAAGMVIAQTWKRRRGCSVWQPPAF